MTDKLQKIREEVERLKSQLLRGACSSQVAMETRCKEEAYKEVLAILDTMQEEQDDVDNLIKSQNNSIKVLNETLYSIERNNRATKEHVDYDKLDTILDESLSKETKESLNEWLDKKCMYAQPNYTNGERLVLCEGCEELCKYNPQTAAESLGISQEEYDKIVDECIYGKESELVDADDLPNKKEESASEGLEDAAKNHAVERYKATRDMVLAEKCKWSFKAGAEWQQQRDNIPQELVEAYWNAVKTGVKGTCDVINAINWFNKPVSEIDFEQELYKAFGHVKDFTLCLKIARRFYDMGKNSQEPASEELEEASKEWLRPQLDKSYANYGEAKMMELTHFDGYAMLDAIEFGANRYKKQMIKDAYEREVKVDAGGYPYIPQMELYDYDKDVPLAKEGDKYKVVLIKED